MSGSIMVKECRSCPFVARDPSGFTVDGAGCGASEWKATPDFGRPDWCPLPIAVVGEDSGTKVGEN